MTTYPLDAPARVALRAAARQDLLDRAECEALRAGCSQNCAGRLLYNTHPTDGPGCANAGDGCLCACHDR